MAGVAALAIQAHPGYTPEQIKRVLKANTRDLGYNYERQGAGEIDALATVINGEPGPPLSSMTPSGVWFGGVAGEGQFSETITLTGSGDIETSGYPMLISPVIDGQFVAVIDVSDSIEDGTYISSAHTADARFVGAFIKDSVQPTIDLGVTHNPDGSITIKLSGNDNLCLESQKIRKPNAVNSYTNYTYIVNRSYYCNPAHYNFDKCFPTQCLKSKTSMLGSAVLPDGQYLVEAWVYDIAGNVAYDSTQVTIPFEPEPRPDPDPDPVDATPPTLTLLAPAEGSVVARKSSFVVTAGAADEESGVAFVRMQQGDSICTDASTPYSCKFYTTGKPSTGYTVSVYAQDEAGNKSATETVTVYSETNRK
jgi:hypothetical protein